MAFGMRGNYHEDGADARCVYVSLREAKKLLDEGVITQEEFQREKENFFADTN